MTTPRLLVHGDSFIGPLSLLHANIVKIGGKHRGASARGLGNPTSTLQVGPKVLASLTSSKPAKVLVGFGNVDMQIHFLYQAATKGAEARGAEEWAKYVWAAYEGWLSTKVLPLLVDNTEGFIEHVFLAAVLLPTVTDEHLPASFHSYTGLDVPVGRQLPSFSSRTLACSTFNGMLAAFCTSHSRLHLVDVNPHLLDPATGIIAAAYIDPNPRDMHPMWEGSVPHWIRAMREAAVDEAGEPVLDITEKHVRVDLAASEKTYRYRGKRRA